MNKFIKIMRTATGKIHAVTEDRKATLCGQWIFSAQIYETTDISEITCKKCLKKLNDLENK